MNNSAFITTLPDFIEIQRASFCWFLSKGLSEELANFSVIEDLTNSITLNFFGNDFRIQKPLLDIVETKARDRTFAVRIYVPVLISKVKNFDNFNKDKIYTFIGEIPLMTDRGTFVVNGCERVIVNQIVRSPGIYYKRSFTTTRYNCSATLIPFRGGWLGFEIEHKYKKEETRPVGTVSFNKIQKEDLAKFLTLIGIKSSKIHSYFLHPEFFDCIETVEVVDQVGFNSQIFDSKYFNLGHVGRFKLNQQLDLNIPITTNELTKQDLVIIIDGLINLFYGEGETDDIDHLKNRRVRSVGELLQTQFRSGLMRFERILSERMTFCDPNCIVISALVNPKPIMSMMREFFGSSQLSQFLDQTNPLAELTHKRRLSGLGPGGFNRDHVSLAVRDIHSSHYGRICPIETPEGKNAGLWTVGVARWSTYMNVLPQNINNMNDVVIRERLESSKEKLKLLTDAKSYYEQGFESAKEHSYLLGIKIGCLKLSSLYESQGNYKKSSLYLKYLNKIKTLQGEEELKARIELADQEKQLLIEKEQSKNDLKFKNTFLRLLSIIVGVLILFLLLLFYAFKTKSSFLKKLEISNKKILSIQKEKDDFLAYTSHEIRTPLSAVVGSAELLESTKLSAVQKKHLSSVKTSANNILFLVNDILDLSKLEKKVLKEASEGKVIFGKQLPALTGNQIIINSERILISSKTQETGIYAKKKFFVATDDEITMNCIDRFVTETKTHTSVISPTIHLGAYITRRHPVLKGNNTVDWLSALCGWLSSHVHHDPYITTSRPAQQGSLANLRSRLPTLLSTRVFIDG